jgi:hypothetical protein
MSRHFRVTSARRYRRTLPGQFYRGPTEKNQRRAGRAGWLKLCSSWLRGYINVGAPILKAKRGAGECKVKSAKCEVMELPVAVGTRRGLPPQCCTHHFELCALSYPAIGITAASSNVISPDVRPRMISVIVQVLSASTSVSTPIFAKIQKPESFIHEPTSEPDPIASAR